MVKHQTHALEPNVALNIMIVDDTPRRAALLEQGLLDAGHHVIVRLRQPYDLLREVRKHQPDVIIIEVESPDRDTLEHICVVSRDDPKPVVIFAEKSDEHTIREALRAGVSAYVVDGVDRARVQFIVQVAVARFREYQAMREELEQAKTTIADNKTIDRAKGIVMRQRQCSEQQAYALLRKLAMDQNKRIAEIARNVLSAAQVLSDV